MFQVCDCMPCLAVEKNVPFWLCQEHGTICCAATRLCCWGTSQPKADPQAILPWCAVEVSKNMAVLYIPPVPQKALIQKRHQSISILWIVRHTHTYTPTDMHTSMSIALEHIFAWHLGEVCDVFGQCSALKQLISTDAYRKTERVEDLA